MNLNGLLKNLNLDACEYYNEYVEKFLVEYVYNSNRIEGNPMSMDDVSLLLNHKEIVNKTHLVSIFETVNHLKILKEVISNATVKMTLSEEMVKDIHHELMDNIMIGGVYRNHNVSISNSQHTPPSGSEMYDQIKNFFATLSYKESLLEPVELAAYTHAEFVKIHPFTDGNGRTARLIMNYQLIKNNLLPIYIPVAEKEEYFRCLEAYSTKNNIRPLTKYIYQLEVKELNNVSKCKDKTLKKRKKELVKY